MAREFDAHRRKIAPWAGTSPTRKQFFLLLYLALRRSDSSDGRVTIEEIASRVPFWSGLSIESAGKAMSKLGETAWFATLVESTTVMRGPYRLKETPVFVPDRESANEILATIRMPIRKRKSAKATNTALSPVELQAYDLLVQYGVYLPPVVDLIVQRIGHPERLRDPRVRLTASRILVTMHKNRGDITKAVTLAQKALKVATRLGDKDAYAYLLDQIGGCQHIDGKHEEARHTFDSEIVFLKGWGSQRAEFHLVGAYRGLAATLRASGQFEAARNAIFESTRYAERSGNEEGLRLSRLQDPQGNDPDEALKLIHQLPTEHLVARMMALGNAAEVLLRAGVREEGEQVLRRAHHEAQRFGLKHEIQKCELAARLHGITLA